MNGCRSLKRLKSCDGRNFQSEFWSFKLHHLDVSGNAITQIEEGDLPDTKEIQHFNASHNQIRHIHPIFRQMPNLITLDLSFNKLNALLDPAVFQQIPHHGPIKSILISSKHSSYGRNLKDKKRAIHTVGFESVKRILSLFQITLGLVSQSSHGYTIGPSPSWTNLVMNPRLAC